MKSRSNSASWRSRPDSASTLTCRPAASSTRSNASVTATTRSFSTFGATTVRQQKVKTGAISELLAQNGIPTTTKQQIDALADVGGLDALGTPLADNQYNAAWAWAGSTPYKGTKLLASHFGGTRNPMAIRWPARIKPDPVPRTQFHHCQRHRSDDLRSPRDHAALRGQWRATGSARRRQLCVYV